MARNTNNSWVAAVPPSGKTITNYSLENNAVEVIEVGNVLVANGVSVPDTEINMRVRAKYNDGTYGPYSNVETIAAVTTGILFQDDFTGTTIDTGKWAVTTPNASRSSVSQNGELDLSCFELTNDDFANVIPLINQMLWLIHLDFSENEIGLHLGSSFDSKLKTELIKSSLETYFEGETSVEEEAELKGNQPLFWRNYGERDLLG